MRATRSSRVLMFEMSCCMRFLRTFQMFSIMLISGDCAGEEIIDILCSVSNDKFAKNGAQKCCHPERTTACYQSKTVFNSQPATNSPLRRQYISKNQYSHQLVLSTNAIVRNTAPEHNRHFSTSATTFHQAFSKHKVCCFCQLQIVFHLKISPVSSHPWHSKSAFACTRKPANYHCLPNFPPCKATRT